MRLSKHADVRGRERGVEILSLLLIKCFGHPVKGADGSEVWIANKRERKEILKQCKAAQRNFERPDPPYFVEASDSTVITVAVGRGRSTATDEGP